MNIKETLENLNIKETLSTLKESLGFEAQEVEEGIYIPAESALKVAAPKKTNYDNTKYDNPYQGKQKILMVCTEQQLMTMENGKKFKTGNHPVEMMVPILHFKEAGFDVDLFTPSGKPVAIEEWAMPTEDDQVQQIYQSFKDKLQNPNSLAEFVQDKMADSNDYVAIFIPGGHGAMLGLPEDKNLGELLRWGYDKDLYTLAICHGPSALLAANLDSDASSDTADNSDKEFIFNGYEIVAFPDVMDKQMPKMGYLPGDMPWYFGEKLEALGMTINNKLAVGHTHQDRKLISGDGPLAANDFGKLAAQELLKMFQ